MAKKTKTTKPGLVEKIILSPIPNEPEKAQIAVEGADHLYREIRIENTLTDEQGKKVQLKKGAETVKFSTEELCMAKKTKTTKPGIVEKIIPSPIPNEPEKAQIAVEGADHLYREIRIENTLTDEQGKKVQLKKGAEVDVTIEADPEATTPKTKGGK